MEIQILPSHPPLSERVTAEMSLFLEHHLGRARTGIETLKVGFYGGGAPIQPGIHMVLFQVALANGRMVRIDGFIGDLRDVYGDRLFGESVARLRNEISDAFIH